jgi:hypothetical protein
MENNKSVTAVEWLVEKMLNQDWYTYKSLEYIQQAKEMEKQQIIDACGSMYSEEEVKEILLKTHRFNREYLDICLEQFKNNETTNND